MPDIKDTECIYWFQKICTNCNAPKAGQSYCRGIKDCDVWEINETNEEKTNAEMRLLRN